MSWVRDSWLL